MEIFYKCSCMPVEAKITVTDRHPNGEIEDWMALVSMAISTDHRARSPRCKATAMEYAKIPVIGDDTPIGVRPVRN